MFNLQALATGAVVGAGVNAAMGKNYKDGAILGAAVAFIAPYVAPMIAKIVPASFGATTAAPAVDPKNP